MSVKYFHIVARSKNGIIGVNNTIPWSSKLDMNLFKDFTSRHIVIMGRKTYDSLPKKLVGRYIVVLTREAFEILDKDEALKGEYVIFSDNVEKGVKLMLEKIPENISKDKVLIAGGGEIYTLTNDIVEGALVSEIDAIVTNGDATYTLPESLVVKHEMFYNIAENTDPFLRMDFYSKTTEGWSL